MELRDYQKDVIAQVYGLFKAGKKSVLVFAPTGAGKTVIGAKMIKDAISKGRRVLFCCHRKKLVSQTADTIRKICGVDAGLIVPSVKEDFDSSIQIGMLQTLQSRFEKRGKLALPQDIGLVIFDEAHASTSFSVVQEIMNYYSNGLLIASPCYFVGLSATPWRTNDKEGFCQYFQAVAKAPSPRELINKGYLVRPVVYKYQGKLGAALETDNSGDYTMSSLVKACNGEYNQDVVDKTLAKSPNSKTIAFCASVKQAEDMRDKLVIRGVKVAVVVGNTPDKERAEIFEQFKTGQIQWLVSVAALAEGFDETSIECVVIARPTRSPALLIQSVGRGLRLHDKKTEVEIFDFGGCFDWMETAKLKGYKVTDPFGLDIVPLCPRIKPPSEFSKTKVCDGCGNEIPIFAKICPHCGKEFKGEVKMLPRELEFPDLVEYMTSAERKAYSWLRSELKKYWEKGKNPMPIFEKFYERFDYFPRREWCVGTLFGLKNPDLEAQIYIDKLKRNNLTITDDELEFLLMLEFGEPDKTYILPSGITYTGKQLPLDRFDWSSYLGITKFSSEQEIREAYKKALVSQDQDDLILNYSLETALAVRGGRY